MTVAIKERSSRKHLNSVFWFDELSTNEIESFLKAYSGNRVVILPVGSVEEHGQHLPLCTDSLQPEFVAVEVSKKTGCLVAPTIRYGVCDSARNFPGTLSISFEALYCIVRDIIEELIRNGFLRILVLSGHAEQSHMAALRLAAQKIILRYQEKGRDKRPRIAVCSDYDFAYELRGKEFSAKDGHAGTIETSRVMAIRPELVKKKGKRSYTRPPRFEIISDPERYFPSGAIGDPTAATKEKGEKINNYIIDKLTELVKELSK